MSSTALDEMLATRDVRGVSPHTWNRWQTALRTEIQPQLEKLRALMDAEAERLAGKKVRA